MVDNTLIFSIFLIYTIAALLSIIALYCRQSLLVAYMVLGVIMGPWSLQWVNDAYIVQRSVMSELFSCCFCWDCTITNLCKCCVKQR